MPEAPDVRLFADKLRYICKNKKIISIKILSGRYKRHGDPHGFDRFKKTLPCNVKKITVKGKLLFIEFDNGFYLLNSLGMTGGWSDIFDPSCRIEFITNKKPFYYTDQRSYGTIKFTDDKNELMNKLASLGPDIMDLYFTPKILKDRLMINPNMKLGEILMEQKIISGCGNYIRAEAMWYAKLSPHRQVKTLNEDDIKNLCHALRYIAWIGYSIHQAKKYNIMKRGDIIPDTYNRKHFIYRQKEDIYGNKVTRETMAGRTLHWVKKIQN